MISISIIIPAYNSELYIKDCLDSVLVTSRKDIECIIINDGSVDDTLKIIEDYRNYDNRIKVYSTENMGVAHARNIGLKYALGKYVLFLDSDDYLVSNAWNLIGNAINCNYDVYVFNYLEQRGKKPKLAIPVTNNDLNYEQIVSELSIYNSYLNSSCGKLLKKEIIDSYQISFPNDVKFGEDACFVMDFLCHANSIFVNNDMIFTYRMHLTNSINNVMLSRLDDYDRENRYRKKLANCLGIHDYLSKLNSLNARTLMFFCISFIETIRFKDYKATINKIIVSNYFNEINYNMNLYHIPVIYRMIFSHFVWKNYILCFLLFRILGYLKRLKKEFI